MFVVSTSLRNDRRIFTRVDTLREVEVFRCFCTRWATLFRTTVGGVIVGVSGANDGGGYSVRRMGGDGVGGVDSVLYI